MWAWASSAVSTRCQLPSIAWFRSLVWTPFHDRDSAGGQVYGDPVRNLHATASITCRCSRRRPPRSDARSGGEGSIRGPWASLGYGPGATTGSGPRDR